MLSVGFVLWFAYKGNARRECGTTRWHLLDDRLRDVAMQRRVIINIFSFARYLTRWSGGDCLRTGGENV